MKNTLCNMKQEFVRFLETIGIEWKWVLNGLMGSIVWSFYKKLPFLEALRQMLIGSIVAGYITPLIANRESIPPEFLASLSFVIGMTGMLIVDGIYKYIAYRVKKYKRGKKLVQKEDADLENSEK